MSDVQVYVPPPVTVPELFGARVRCSPSVASVSWPTPGRRV